MELGFCLPYCRTKYVYFGASRRLSSSTRCYYCLPYNVKVSAMEKQSRKRSQGKLRHGENSARNSSGLPQVPWAVSAGCCECPILIILPLVSTWKPHLKGSCSAWDSLYLELQMTLLQGLPQNFCRMF